MNKLSPSCSITRVLTILTGLLAIALSSPAIAQPPEANDFDRTKVTDIELIIAEDNLDQFGFNLPTTAMAAKIIDNLAEWHFPVKATSTKTFSHTLEAHIGPQSHQQTPVGFSFSSGNSDPRSHEFQKADVISITCSLSDKNTRQSASLTMGFSAGPITGAAKKIATQEKSVGLLVDHMSTVCYDLLEELDLELPAEPSEKSVSKPGWMPEIMIETEELAQPPTEITSPDKKAKESTKSAEGRRKITIHNQGTPVILKFGHDR